MHFDESQIAALHDEALASWPEHAVLFHATALASVIVDATAKRYSKGDGYESWILAVLASRQRNTIGAAARLIHLGYYAPAASLLRDLADCGLLFDFLRFRPEKITQWGKLVGQPRHDQFSSAKLLRDLRSNGINADHWKLRIDFYSEFGVHPSGGSFVNYIGDFGIQTQPFADKKKFASLTISWAQDTTLMVRAFVDLADNHHFSGPKPTMKMADFAIAEAALFHQFPLEGKPWGTIVT